MDEVKAVENNLCLFQFFQNYLLFNVHVFKSLLFSSILKVHSHNSHSSFSQFMIKNVSVISHIYWQHILLVF